MTARHFVIVDHEKQIAVNRYAVTHLRAGKIPDDVEKGVKRRFPGRAYVMIYLDGMMENFGGGLGQSFVRVWDKTLGEVMDMLEGRPSKLPLPMGDRNV